MATYESNTEPSISHEIGLTFLKILVVIFACEMAVTAILYVLTIDGLWAIALDPFLLAGLSTPLLYRLIVSPIRNALVRRKRAVPKDHRPYKFAEVIEKETDRIVRIVHQMFDLYRPGQEKIEDVAVGMAIEEVVALLEPSRREREVRVEIDVDPPGASVRAPEGSLRQVLSNLTGLLQNAPPS